MVARSAFLKTKQRWHAFETVVHVQDQLDTTHHLQFFCRYCGVRHVLRAHSSVMAHSMIKVCACSIDGAGDVKSPVHGQLTAEEGESSPIRAENTGTDDAVMFHFLLAGHLGSK